MNRKEAAFLVSKQMYRRPVVADRPKNSLHFAIGYGTLHKFYNYLRVIRAYKRKEIVVPGRPFEIRVDPTSLCNLRCPLCPTGCGSIDRKPGFMSMEVFSKILAELRASAFCVHLWVWGEPLLHKDIGEMVAVASEHGLGTEISTNLSVQLSDAAIDRMIKGGLDWLIVSIDAASAEVYDRYRIGGDFNLAIDNMRRFIRRKKALGSATPFVEWQFIPLRINEMEMEKAVDLAREIRVDGLRFKPARLDKVEDLTFCDTIPAKLKDVWLPERDGLSHSSGSGQPFHDAHCPFLWKSVTMHWDASLAFCCETSLMRDDVGIIGPEMFEETWNGPIYQHARRSALGLDPAEGEEPGGCSKCRVFGKPYSRGARST